MRSVSERCVFVFPVLRTYCDQLKELSVNVIDILVGRVSPTALVEPGPTQEQLQEILVAGASAPDHGRMKPWRFVLIQGNARSRFGDLMAQSLARREPGITEVRLEAERKKALRAPTIIGIAAALRDNPTVPEVEQILAVGAAAQNILIASHGLGFGGFWRTGSLAYDPDVKRAFGLSEADSIVGFIYIGSVGQPGRPHQVQIDEFVRYF
jgi:nitroreductase